MQGIFYSLGLNLRDIFYALASRQVHKKSPSKKMSSFFSQTFFLPGGATVPTVPKALEEPLHHQEKIYLFMPYMCQIYRHLLNFQYIYLYIFAPIKKALIKEIHKDYPIYLSLI